MTLTRPDHDEVAGSSLKSRDAERTRQHLLQAARLRFARDGYSGTTVRDIATDAGVNVALINRYFISKEGLFEACLNQAVAEFDAGDDREYTFDDMLRTLVQRIADAPNGEKELQLLLLLRSSGDANADRIRQNTVHSYTERMATVAGWREGNPATAHLLLRAQVALATAFGIVLLRSSTGVEPLTSATESELTAPLNDVLRALLSPSEARRT